MTGNVSDRPKLELVSAGLLQGTRQSSPGAEGIFGWPGELHGRSLEATAVVNNVRRRPKRRCRRGSANLRIACLSECNTGLDAASSLAVAVESSGYAPSDNCCSCAPMPVIDAIVRCRSPTVAVVCTDTTLKTP